MIDGIDYASITDTFWIVDQAFELFEFNRSFSVLQAELSPDPYFGSFADITTNATYIWIPKMGTPSKIYRYWHQNSFPNNIFLDVGNDGDHEFNNTGSFEIEVNIDFTDELNSLLSDCNLVGDNCSIPFKFHSDTVGEIRYHSIEIEYEYTMENEYFFDTIGNHSEEGSFIWNISNIQEQSDVNIRTRAIDLEGSNKFSDYFTSESNITLSQNNPPIIKSVFILPIDPHTEDNLTCGINITDVDVGDTLTANVTWLKNNDPHTSDDEQLNITNGNLIFTTQVGDIEANDTIIYDEWICVVTAYDGISSTLKSSNTTTIVPHAIFNFSLLNVTDLDAVFEFTILDNNLSISLFSWILDTGEGHSINSTENIFLNDMENIFVIIEYNYTSSGQYNVTAKVDLGEVEDTKTINITI